MQNVKRYDITDLENIPDVGHAIAGNLLLIDVALAEDLLERAPFEK